MEPVFSNACRYTKDNLREMAKAALPKWYKVYCAVFTLIFAAFAVNGIFGGRTMMGILFAAFAVLMIIVYLSKTSPEKAYRQSVEKYGREAEIRLFFYDGFIIGKNLAAGNTVKTEYEKISYIAETENLYVLGLSIGMSIIVDKNGFISNNGAEFSDFIKSKCPGAKVR